MKFKSQLVTQVSGSVGGATGARNRGGMYLRARGIPANGNTPGQQSTKIAFQQATKSWRELLTAAQRAAWKAYAEDTPVLDSLGDSRVLSGSQAYNKANNLRISRGDGAIQDAPTTGGGTTGVYQSVVISAATGIATFTVAGVQGTDLEAYAFVHKLRLSAGVTSFKGSYTFDSKNDLDMSLADTQTFTVDMAAIFGTLAVGDVIAFRVLVSEQDTPRFFSEVKAQAVVTA